MSTLVESYYGGPDAPATSEIEAAALGALGYDSLGALKMVLNPKSFDKPYVHIDDPKLGFMENDIRRRYMANVKLEPGEGVQIAYSDTESTQKPGDPVGQLDENGHTIGNERVINSFCGLAVELDGQTFYWLIDPRSDKEHEYGKTLAFIGPGETVTLTSDDLVHANWGRRGFPDTAMTNQGGGALGVQVLGEGYPRLAPGVFLSVKTGQINPIK